LKIYDDKAATRSFGRDDLLTFARDVETEITFQRLDGYSVSPAEVFGLLNGAMAEFGQGREVPSESRVTQLYGPSRTYLPPNGGTQSPAFQWRAFAAAVRETSDFCKATGRLPDEIWIGSESLSPADYLATLAHTFDGVVTTGRAPATVARRAGRFTADRYVAEDSPSLWGW